MTDSLPDQLKAAAHEVNEIIWGRIEPRMRIPADQGDTDLRLGRLFREVEAALRSLKQERDALIEGFQLAADETGYEGDWHDSAPIHALVAERDELKAVIVKAAVQSNTVNTLEIINKAYRGLGHE